MLSGNRNVARIRHDRTLEIALGLRGSNGEKEGGQLRFYCDFRYLNAVTIKDAYPIPRIDESLSKIGDVKFFTTLDLGSAFWQVPLRKKAREETGLSCELGFYQRKRMPFGLCNATAIFQRLMAQTLGSTKSAQKRPHDKQPEKVDRKWFSGQRRPRGRQLSHSETVFYAERGKVIIEQGRDCGLQEKR